MNLRKLFSGCICLTALALANQAQAAFVSSGNIYTVLDGAGTRIASTVDHWYFTVNAVGLVTFDLLSMETPDFTTAVDVNGDGEIAFFDPYIHLFFDDGSLDVGDYITEVDDSGATFGDGSIHGYDSYLSLPLAAGNYILAVGAFFLPVADAIDGLNESSTFYPVTMSGGAAVPHDHGDYQITWDGDVTVTRGPGVVGSVPEPASFALLGIGGLGLTFLRRRKKVAA